MNHISFGKKAKLLFGLFLFLSLSGYTQDVKVSHVSSYEFNQLIKHQKGSLLDVRTGGEFSNGHIPDAAQLNYYSFDFKKKLKLLPKDEPVYLYCNTGYRSKRAGEYLVKNGYSNVYNLKNGIMEWERMDLPVVIEDDADPNHENRMEWDEYKAFVSGNELVLVDFYAPWCGPCRKMMPMVDKLTEDFKGRVEIIKVNAEASKPLIRKLEVMTVPFFVLYKDGKSVWQHEGVLTKNDLEKLFQNNIE